MKNLKILTFLFLAFCFTSCNGIEIERHTTDIAKEKDMSDGHTNRQEMNQGSGPLDGFLEEMNPFGKGDAYFGFGGSITFGTALGKVNFMPLSSVDSGAGIIITEWYNISNDETRIKINVQVLNDEMTDDSLLVQLFQQSFDGSKWVDKGNDAITADKIKFSILEEARLLKTTADLS